MAPPPSCLDGAVLSMGLLQRPPGVTAAHPKASNRARTGWKAQGLLGAGLGGHTPPVPQNPTGHLGGDSVTTRRWGSPGVISGVQSFPPHLQLCSLLFQ